MRSNNCAVSSVFFNNYIGSRYAGYNYVSIHCIRDRIASASIINGQKLNIKMLKQAGVEGESIKFIEELDTEAVRIWRETVIAHFIAAYPGKYRSRLEFHNWAGAMKQLRYVERNLDKASKFK